MDIFLYKRWLNKAASDPQSPSERAWSDIKNMLGKKELLDAGQTDSTRMLAIWSVILGFVSLLSASFNLRFVGRFIFIFLPAFLSVFLGVTVMKTIKSYRENRLVVALAIAGIIAGLISGIGLFVR